MAVLKRTLAAAVALFLLTNGMASAQTITTSSSSTSSTSSTTSTTFVIIDGPCLFYACTERAPDAFVSGSSGEVQAAPGSSCWRRPGPNGVLDIGLCVDTVLPEPATALTVQQGETLRLRFGIRADPRSLTIRTVTRAGGTGPTIAAVVTNPTEFRADFPAGTVLVGISSQWLQGDAFHVVKLDVRGPATPPAAPPGATPATVVRLTG